MKSTFTSDLKKEKKLSLLLDMYYEKHLTHYTTERIFDIKNQMAGIDIIFTHKHTKEKFYIDEKGQLDYINDDLPTFAFELLYCKNNTYKQGWLFDTNKKTDFYALATAIYEDEPSVFTSCKITLVNRKKLCRFLEERKITQASLKKYYRNTKELHGKLKMEELHHRNEGYLYFSTKNKIEKPINLILKLDFLIEQELAKRLI